MNSFVKVEEKIPDECKEEIGTQAQFKEVLKAEWDIGVFNNNTQLLKHPEPKQNRE